MHSCVPWDMPNCQNNWFFQTGGYLHQKLTTSLGGGSTSFFIFLPILEKKYAKSMKVWFAHLNSYIHHFSQLSMFFGGGPFLLHIFYPIKACNVRRDYCKCTNCSICSCWKHWFWKNLLIRQLSTAVLLSWERWLYLWTDFRLSEQ